MSDSQVQYCSICSLTLSQVKPGQSSLMRGWSIAYTEERGQLQGWSIALYAACYIGPTPVFVSFAVSLRLMPSFASGFFVTSNQPTYGTSLTFAWNCHCSNSPAHGVVADLVKAFNALPIYRGPCFEFLGLFGTPPCICGIVICKRFCVILWSTELPAQCYRLPRRMPT